MAAHSESYTSTTNSIAGGRFLSALSQVFTDGIAAVASLDSAFPDVDGIPALLSVASGTLPNGVTLEPLGKRLVYDGTSGISTANVDIKGEPLAPTLTVGGSGNVPVMAAVCFPKGYVFGNIGTTITGVYATVTRTWNDGSVKHAIVTGVAPGGTIIKFNQTPQTGINLQHSDIVAKAPTASIDLGAVGTANLTSLLSGVPSKVYISTPGMVECNYIANSLVTGITFEFQVRLFANGDCFVRVLVQSSARIRSLTSTAQVLSGTVIIDGTTVYNYESFNLWQSTSHIHERWIGSTQYTHLVKNNHIQLGRTKLVPNYGMTTYISESSLNALLTNYTPNSRLGYTAAMGDGGYQAQIGLLPQWDACYVVSGDDRALRAVFAHGKAAYTWPITWREGNRMLLPTDYPTQNYGNGGGAENCLVGSLQWEMSHHPSMGYLAYLVSGDQLYLDAMLGQSALIFQLGSTALGSGVNRKFIGSQIRLSAWVQRTLGQASAITPNSNPAFQPMQDIYATQIAYYASVSSEHATAQYSTLGYPCAYSTYNQTKGQSTASWMHHFWIGTMGHCSDIEAYSPTKVTQFINLRNWMYQGITGILGDSSGFCFTRAPVYSMIISSEVVPNFTYRTAASLFQNWTDVWNANFPGVGCSNTLEEFPYQAARGYWGNLLPAIAHAVDQGAVGALTCWNRMKNATNWSVLAACNFYDDPVWAVAPRTIVASASKHVTIQIKAPAETLPAWRKNMTPNTWKAIPASNTISSLDPKNNPLMNPVYPNTPEWYGNTGQSACISAWCGAAWAEERGELRLPLQGGHQDYGGNEAYSINLFVDTPIWRMLRPPSGAIGNVLTTNDGKESTGNYTDGRPRAIHTWNKHVYVPGLGFVMAHQGNCWYSGQSGTKRTMLQDDNGEWTTLATNPYASDASAGGACYDSKRNGLWWFPGNDVKPSFFDLTTKVWTHKTTWQYHGTDGARCPIYVPDQDLLITLHTGYISVWNITTGLHYEPSITGTQQVGLSFTDYCGAAWDAELQKLVLWHNASNTTIISTLTPTGDFYIASWAWGTLPVSSSNTVTPTVRQGWGTYGRFFYSKKLKGYGLLNGTGQPIYFYAKE